MHLFDRNQVIKDLLYQMDIPRLLYPDDTFDSIGPHDPEYFSRYAARRRDSETDAINALDAATNEELWELSETPGCLRSFEVKFLLFDPPPWYAGGFGVEYRKADFGYWAKMDFWTLEEATCLSIGFKPESMPKKPVLPSPRSTLVFFYERFELFRRADLRNGKSPDQIEPREFVAWVLEKEIEIPKELERILGGQSQNRRPAMLKTVDVRKYDSALKVLLGLISNEYSYHSGNVGSE